MLAHQFKTQLDELRANDCGRHCEPGFFVSTPCRKKPDGNIQVRLSMAARGVGLVGRVWAMGARASNHGACSRGRAGGRGHAAQVVPVFGRRSTCPLLRAVPLRPSVALTTPGGVSLLPPFMQTENSLLKVRRWQDFL